MSDDATYDDLCAFARLMLDTAWQWSSEPAERMLEYFEKPWKWSVEYDQWKRLGGTLDKPVTQVFENWLDHRNDPDNDDDEN